MQMKYLTAKFDGRCAGCGSRFPVGEKIAWIKVDGKGRSYHLGCEPQGEEAEQQQQQSAEEENPRYADYLAYCEYYKDEPDWF